MDYEVGWADLGEQTTVFGPLKQSCEMSLGLALQLRKGVLAKVTHEAKDIDIHYALEEVKQGDDAKFIVLEGISEAELKRGAQRLVAALLFVGILNLLLTTADGFHEVRNSLSAAQPRLDRLAHENPQR